MKICIKCGTQLPDSAGTIGDFSYGANAPSICDVCYEKWHHVYQKNFRTHVEPVNEAFHDKWKSVFEAWLAETKPEKVVFT